MTCVICGKEGGRPIRGVEMQDIRQAQTFDGITLKAPAEKNTHEICLFKLGKLLQIKRAKRELANHSGT